MAQIHRWPQKAGKACGWKHPRASSSERFQDDRAAFLRDQGQEHDQTGARRGEEEGGEGAGKSEDPIIQKIRDLRIHVKIRKLRHTLKIRKKLR